MAFSCLCQAGSEAPGQKKQCPAELGGFGQLMWHVLRVRSTRTDVNNVIMYLVE